MPRARAASLAASAWAPCSATNTSAVRSKSAGTNARASTVTGSAGYSVKIASDDDYDAGGNVVENNHLTNSVVALKLETESTQGAICGNTVATLSLIENDDEDTAPGDTNGQDVGEVWYIVTPGMQHGDEPHHEEGHEMGEEAGSATPASS